MRRCSVKPYEGSKEYIFVSYCHKDKAHVFPIIEQLVKDGYRIWYDEGIDPGSEWPEIIAHHLNCCSLCIAFISQNSLNSHNCRREINFALLKKKPFISIIVEPVQMSLGMEMQLSSSQSIFKYTLPTQSEFFDKLYSGQSLTACLGSRDDSIFVSKYEDYDIDSESYDKVREPFSDRWFVESSTSRRAEEARRITKAEERKRADETIFAAEAEERRRAEEARRIAEAEERRRAEEARLTAEAEERRKAEEARRIAEAEERRRAEEARLAAEAEEHRKAEEARRIAEAEERRRAEEARLVAEAEERRKAEEARRIAEAEECRRADETIFAGEINKRKTKTHVIKRVKTNEIITLDRSRFVVGRSEAKADYVISDNRTISRSHAIFIIDNERCYVTDDNSLNKTYVNGHMLVAYERKELKDGDVINIYNEKFVYYLFEYMQ